MDAKDKVGFASQQKVIKDILKNSFKYKETKVKSDALILLCKLLDVFVEEACARAKRQAEIELCSEEVEVHHFEKILPQLILDF